MFKALAYVFYSELRLQLRQSQAWLYPLAFYGITLCFIPFLFASNDETALAEKLLPGYVWLAALFASLLAIQTVFVADLEDGHLAQLLLSNLPLSALILVKLAVQWVVVELPLILLTPLIGFLFHYPYPLLGLLCLSLVLGTPIITLLGSFTVALTLGLRQAGLLLSLLLLPLITPVLIFGVNLLHQAKMGLNVTGPLAFLAGLSLLCLALLPLAIAHVISLMWEEGA